jgi:hypothetical protein
MVHAAVRGTATRCVQLQGHSDTVHAAIRGMVMYCVQPQRPQRRGTCSCKGHSNTVRAAAKATVMRYMQLRGHSDVECVSIVTAFHPRCTFSPSPSVVGPGGPSRESCAMTRLLQKRKLAKKTKEKMIKHTRKKNCLYLCLG